MTTLDAGFEDALEAAIIDKAEARAREQWGPALLEAARENWRDYINTTGYDIEHIPEEAELSVDRAGDEITIRIEFPGLTALFEWGVDPHTKEGNPLLFFIWESPPQGTRPFGAPEVVLTESVNWGSVTGGIPEAAAIRDAFRRVST